MAQSDDTTQKDRPAPRRRTIIGTRRKTTRAALDPEWLPLAASGRYVRPGRLIYDAHARFLLAEDIAWQFANDDWAARRPRWWCSAERRAWQLEGAQLEAKRQRLTELARVRDVAL